EADQRHGAGAFQDDAAGRRKIVAREHLKISRKRGCRHRVCRKSTTALISRSVRMRLRPNGGITVSGLRLVSSTRMATSSLRSGYLLLMFSGFGPMLPGRLPPLMS